LHATRIEGTTRWVSGVPDVPPSWQSTPYCAASSRTSESQACTEPPDLQDGLLDGTTVVCIFRRSNGCSRTHRRMFTASLTGAYPRIIPWGPRGRSAHPHPRPSARGGGVVRSRRFCQRLERGLALVCLVALAVEVSRALVGRERDVAGRGGLDGSWERSPSSFPSWGKKDRVGGS
jgi:hypothetical protein